MYTKLLVGVSVTVVLLYIAIYCSYQKIAKPKKFKENYQVVTTVCGIERTEEAIVLIKSALIFSSPKDHLTFLVVTETTLFQLFDEKLQSFQKFYPNFSFKLIEIEYPNVNGDSWKNMFKLCASLRLFLPALLPYVDALLYVDCDTIFLSPPREVFQLFQRFNSSQLAGLVSESENINTGWYPRFARHPFYGKFGVNSGVMLMNLNKMRKSKWNQLLPKIYEEYNMSLTFGDQDIINIYFHFHPDQLYILPCEFNYRPDHCTYMSSCPINDGIKILHGNRGSFHNSEIQPIFHQIYDAIQKYQFNTSLCKFFIEHVKFQVKETNSSKCSQLSKKFLQNSENFIGSCDNNETD